MRPVNRARGISAGIVVLLAASSATAQETPDEIARRGLIEQAEQAREAGDHPRALDLALRAGAIRMTPSVRQIIAYEHDAVGHLLEALDAADGCEREARTDPTLRNRERIQEACRSLGASLRARVAWITVRVPSTAPTSVRVTVNGAALRAPLWGVERPTLPGALAIDAVADAARFHRVVTLAASAHAEVLVELSTATASHAPPRGPGVAPWIVVGGGALALSAAVVFAALRGDARASRDAGCDRDGCDASTRDLDADFRRYTVLTDAALGVGAAAVLGGVTWYLVARRGATPPAVTVAITPTASGATLGVGGSL